MKVSTQDYVARISVASPLQLVIINYEIIIDYLNCSKHYINDKNAKNEFIFNINKARDFLGELRASLNMQYEISYYLMSLYNYVDKILAFSLFNKNLNYIDKAIFILEKLLNSWVKIQSDEEDKTPVMENVEHIFSGMTYNKNGTLNEYVDTNSERGFKV